MTRMKSAFFLWSMAVVAFPLATAAQLVVDRTIQLIGSDAADRQVLGLPVPTGPTDVLTAGAEQAGSFRTATPSAGAEWVIDLPLLSTTPTAGTHIMVRTPSAIAGPVSLSVNAGPPVQVLINGGGPLLGEDVMEGTMLSLVHDGTSFQVMNGSTYMRRPCPSGLTPVDDQFCIESVERAPLDFFPALEVCGSLGLRACRWGEYFMACENATALGLSNMANNWEWTADASNENGVARIVSAFGCSSAGNSFITAAPRNFRCCYSR